jgi:hypothetical protein
MLSLILLIHYFILASTLAWNVVSLGHRPLVPRTTRLLQLQSATTRRSTTTTSSEFVSKLLLQPLPRRSFLKASSSFSPNGDDDDDDERRRRQDESITDDDDHVATTTTSTKTTTVNHVNDLILLQSENTLLRETIRKLEDENQQLKLQRQRRPQQLVLENFEGERFFWEPPEEKEEQAKSPSSSPPTMAAAATAAGGGLTMTGDVMSSQEIVMQSQSQQSQQKDELWCDTLDDGTCPIEPSISFVEALKDRAYWLVGLLILQSISGVILSRNETLLADHPVVVYFLTMLVGAGGNAGNQASVRGT